jgi:AcrR family transcriptional regulator
MTNQAGTGPGTRDRVLRATIELIAEGGADRVRTRAVAERAGVNAALIHYHFGSMSALIDEAVDAVMAEEMQPFAEALARGPGLRTALDGLLDAVQGVGEPTPGVLVSMDVLVRATRDPATRSRSLTMLQEFRGLLVDRLEQARESGEVDPQLDVAATASMLAALLDGLVVHRLIDRELDVRATAAPLLAALFGSGRAGGPRKGVR